MRYLLFRIEYAGNGISKEERDKVFIPFYQVPESTVANVPGTGIGLSLVYSIVKLCRGGIFIEDMDHPGACFVVVLPISSMAFKEEEIDTSTSEEGIMDSQSDSLNMANRETEMSESIPVAPAAPSSSAPGVSACLLYTSKSVPNSSYCMMVGLVTYPILVMMINTVWAIGKYPQKNFHVDSLI